MAFHHCKQYEIITLPVPIMKFSRQLLTVIGALGIACMLGWLDVSLPVAAEV